MFRHVAYAALVVGFVALSLEGLSGWTGFGRKRDVEIVETTTSRDETPLQVGKLTRKAMHMEIAKRYPWPELREIVPMYERELPRDPTNPSAEGRTTNVSTILANMKMTMPVGTLTWPQVLDALRERFEPSGVKVLSGPPSLQPRSGFTVYLGDHPWTGIHVLSNMYVTSQQTVGYQCSSEGVCVGTIEAVNWEMREAKLRENRDRVAVEHDAAVFDQEFRPEFFDATARGIADVVQSQTGVDLVVDPEIWSDGLVVKWRGEPRKLRDALDQICVKLHAYWRFKDGRVWLLRP